MLLEFSANPNKPYNEEGWTPLTCAAERGEVDVARQLHEARVE